MNEAGGGEPKQHFEVVPTPETESQSETTAVERTRPAAKESAAGKQAAPAALPALPVIPDAPAAAAVTLPKDDSAQPVSLPATTKLPAADADRIEKEWVDKAKAIVAQTKDDPYKQKKEMSKIKADYIGKRYNKQIRTDDAVTA